MGIKQIVVDDWTGVELPDLVNPTSVTVDGDTYDVYLSASSKEAFIQFLQGTLNPGKTTPRKAVAKSAAKEDRTAMREWLQANGHKVSDRGNIKQELKDLYNNRDKSKD